MEIKNVALVVSSGRWDYRNCFECVVDTPYLESIVRLN